MLISSKLLECQRPWHYFGYGEKDTVEGVWASCCCPIQKGHTSERTLVAKDWGRNWGRVKKSHCPQYVSNIRMMNVQGRRILWVTNNPRESQHSDVCLTQRAIGLFRVKLRSREINPVGPTTSLWGPSSRELLASPIPTPSQPQKGRIGERKREKWVE